MGNFCSRERENFDESLNSELNEVAKRKTGESEGADEVNFDNVAQHEEMVDIDSDEAGDAPQGLDLSERQTVEELAEMQKKRQHFEKWVVDNIKNKEIVYDESNGTKLFSADYCCYIFQAAIFWMTVRTENNKKRTRIARRKVLYGTEQPGGPDVEAADPVPEQIVSYTALVKEDFSNSMKTIDDTLTALLAICELDPQQFMTSWEQLTKSAEGQAKQAKCFSNYLEIIEPTLTETQKKETSEQHAPLSEEDGLELFNLKNKIELEILEDIVETKKVMEQIPLAQKHIIAEQLDNAKFLKMSMLSDQIWWTSAGKFEWYYVDKLLQKFVKAKLNLPDEEWVKQVDEFSAKQKALTQAAE